MPTREERNASALAGLHPGFRERVAQLIVLAEGEGMRPLIVQGRRTMAEQAALYAQGRTTDGPKVTNARPGMSYHNYGLAVDLLDLAAAGDPMAYDAKDWQATNYPRLRDLAEGLGLQWGGAWRTFQDKPHFEWHPGLGPMEAATLAAHADAEGRLPDDHFAGEEATA